MEEESRFIYFSGTNTTTKSQFREPPVDISGAESMSFPSRELIVHMIVSVWLCTATKNWGWTPVHSIWCLMKLLLLFCISEQERRDLLDNLCNLQNLRKMVIRNSLAQIDIYLCPTSYGTLVNTLAAGEILVVTDVTHLDGLLTKNMPPARKNQVHM